MAVTRFAKDSKLQRMEWLIPDLIPLGNLTIVSGEPNVGKSRFWTQAGWMISVGQTLFWPKVDPLKVLYCSERDTSEVIEQMHFLDIPYLEGNPNFFLFTIGDMSKEEALDFNKDPLGALHAQVMSFLPQLVIMDTLGQFLVNTNEGRTVHNVNDYGSSVLKMRQFKQWCFWHRIALMGIHHMRKQSMNDSSLRTQDRSLGSQAIVGGTGQAWTLESLTSDGIKTDVRYVKLTPSVHCRPSGDPIFLRARVNQPFEVCAEQEALDANLDSANTLITAPLQVKIIEGLPTSGSPVTKANLADAVAHACNVDPHNVYKAIKRLAEKGKLTEFVDPETRLQMVKIVVKQ